MEDSSGEGTSGELLLAAGIACFDMVSGIKLTRKLKTSERVPSSTLEDLFKTVLANVHRQSDDVYPNFQNSDGLSKLRASTIESSSDNWFMVYSVFLSIGEKRTRPIHHSVGLVFDLEKIPSSPHFRAILERACCTLARAVGTLTLQGTDLSEASKILTFLLSEITEASKHRLTVLPPVEMDAAVRFNYNRLLFSHLTTQMTTVIEVIDGDYMKYASFLSHFLLPYQREMSTLEILEKPCPHLFLQCVREQKKKNWERIVASFGRWLTWVTCKSSGLEIVRYYLPRENPSVYQDDYIGQTLIKELIGVDVTPRNSKPKQNFPTQLDPLTPPVAPWVMRTVDLLVGIPVYTVPSICEQKLKGLVRRALCLVAAASGPRKEPIGEKMLRMSAYDKDLVLAIARIYEPEIDDGLVRLFE